MAKIIHESIGKNYKVPGLPYQDSAEHTKTVILDDVPSEKEVADLLATGNKDLSVNIWTVDVVKGFRDYVPSTYRKITKNMDPGALLEYFGTDKNFIPEEERVLLQLQTEIQAKSATIDAGIIHGRMDLNTIVNKAHLANREYLIGSLYGHLAKRDYPILFKGLDNKDDWWKAMSDIKEVFIQYMLELPLGVRKYDTKMMKTNVSDKDVQRKYPYIEWLKSKLGDNFVADLLYGSSAHTDDTALFSDYDNWVVVNDMRKAHEALHGTNPQLLDGKVIEGVPDEIKGAKDIGLLLLPNNPDYIKRYIRFLHDSKEFEKHSKMLYGEWPFPMVAMDETIYRGLSHRGTKSKTLVGSLNWVCAHPERLITRPKLFEFLTKHVRLGYQAELNALLGPRLRTKKMLNDSLRKRYGIVVPDFKPDPKFIKDALIYTVVCAFRLQKELIAKMPDANLEFLVSEEVREPQPIEFWDEIEDI